MIYVLLSPQSRLLKRALNKILKSELPERNSLNFVTLDMGLLTPMDIYRECSFLPLGCDKKAIVAENCLFLQKGAKPKKRKKKAAEEEGTSDPLISFFKNPDPEILLFLLIYGEQFDEGGEYDLALKEGGARYMNVGEFTDEQWRVFISNFFQKRGVGISDEAIAEIMERTHGDYALFLNEGAKLVTYAQGEMIDKKMVETLVSAPLDQDAFHLINALTQGEKDKAISIYHDMRVKGAAAVSAINLAASQFRFLSQVRHLKEQGDSAYAIASTLGTSPKRVNGAFYSLRRLNAKSIDRALEGLFEAENAIFAGKMSDDLAFSLFLANFEL